MSSKYAKYSTEQLEVIFTHLADPEEQALVKKELSSRYYQHYLNLSEVSRDRPEGLDEPEPDILTAEDVPGAEPEAPADLVELEPIKLTSSPPPEMAAPSPASEKAAKKSCFIATAAYGSPLAREVVLLQQYRDTYLSRTPWGRKFIRTYYRLSPCPAGLISRAELLKSFARYLLTPLLLLIKHHSEKAAPDNS